MSDHYIRVIPDQPDFVPSAQQQRDAEAVFRAARPDAEEISSGTEPHIQFFDSGENFSRVRCPACKSEIDIDEWQEWMAADFSEDTGFALERFVTSCCGTTTTLNELAYEFPQGFAKFALSALHPGEELSQELVAKLESALGCRVRIIYQCI